LTTGDLYSDEGLTSIVSFEDIQQRLGVGTAALIVSDAGAARGRSDLGRLIDTLAFVRGLRLQVQAVAWLNPVPRGLWANTNAAQLARHLPMYTLDRASIDGAVNALRGQPIHLDRPL
jgi:uncharacterized protein with von Willebrand factor type A (vWA) domain